MLSALERNCREAGITLFDLTSGAQGIVHVIGPELGLTQPGMTIACGDSHTSTHGAFGAIALGIGTSQVRDVLASQCLALDTLKVRRIRVTGQLSRGVYAKDVILEIIRRLGVNGGVGYAYEYAGDVVDRMSMDERMTDLQHVDRGWRARRLRESGRRRRSTTFAGAGSRRRGRRSIPLAEWWRRIASDADANYDDEVEIRGGDIRPTVTWGINPGQSVYVDERLPSAVRCRRHCPVPRSKEALSFMGLHEGQPIAGTRIDVAFVGSCTNARLSDLREAARVVRGRHVRRHVKALVVPGSQAVRAAAEREGLDQRVL